MRTIPREREGFRDNLARLQEAFPDKELLTVSDVARYVGADRSTVRRWYKFNATTHRISKVDLARAISM